MKDNKKSIVSRSELLPFILITSLFALWGFANAVTDPMVAAFKFVAFICFFLGRFVCTFLLKYINSGKLLMVLSAAAAALTLGVIFFTGMMGLYCLVAVSFCMSLMFPTIYGITLGNLTEDESKIGAAGLVMAIVGGALMPTLQGMVLDFGGPGYTDIQIFSVSEVNFSFMLPLLCFVVIAFYGKWILKKPQQS